MKKYFIAAVLLVVFNNIFCQLPSNYNGVYSSGEIPTMIINPTYQTYEDSYNQDLKATDSKREEKIKKDFVLSSSYYVNEILTSGNVLFGDDISLYLTKIKNHLIQDEKLAQKINIHLLKSSAVNAFATHQGVIVISTGLLERLDNEAQLAYIISHEISHYVKKHGINSHVENRLEEKNNKEYRKKSDIEKYLLISSRSRDHEVEADEYAFHFYKNSNYSSLAPKEVFQILKTSHLPSKLETSINNLNSEIDDKVYVSTDFSDTPVSELDKDFTKKISTHPAIEDRITNANVFTTQMNSSEDFIVSKEDFKKSKAISQIETLNQLLNDHEYERAIYSAFLVQDEFKEIQYYQKLKLRLFYEMWQSGIYNINKSFTKKYGVDFSTSTQKDIKDIVAKELKKYNKKWKQDVYSEMIFNHLNGTLVTMNSQYQKFTHLGRDDKARFQFFKSYKKSSKGKKIDKILIVNPQWISTDNRHGEHYVQSEVQGKKFIDIAKRNAELAKLDATVLSYSDLKQSNTSSYNDLVLLQDYNRFILLNEGKIIYPRIDDLKKVQLKYGTDKVIFLGCTTTRVKKDKGVALLLGGVSLLPGIIYPPLILFYSPFILSPVMIPEYESTLLFQYYNIETQSIEFVDVFTTSKKSSKTLINSQFFNYFKLIKGKK